MNTTELEPVTETPNLEIMARSDAPAIWQGYRKEFEDLKASTDAVLAADPSVPANGKIAKANRLALRKIRIAIENKRKELGEGLLKKKQEIDGAAKSLRELIEPFEDKLLAVEEFAERAEEERIRKLTAERVAAISKYTEISSAINYGAMPDEEFDKLHADAKAGYELRQAEAARMEQERIAREKAEAEERERIRLENIRLKEESDRKEKELAAERERVEKEKADAVEVARKEREAIEAKAAEEAKVAAAKAKAEREALEAKAKEEARIAKEKADKLAEEARKEREAIEAKAAEEAKVAAAKAKAEREALEAKAKEEARIAKEKADKLAEEARKEREAREALEAKQKAEREAEEAKQAKERSAKEAAALAPDREKLEVFAKSIFALTVPEMTTAKGKTLGEKITAELLAIGERIEKAAQAMKGNQ